MARERAAWLARLVPVLGWVALLGFGVYVFRAPLSRVVGDGQVMAWVTGVCAAGWALGHLTMRLHTGIAPVGRDPGDELRFPLGEGSVPADPHAHKAHGRKSPGDPHYD